MASSTVRQTPTPPEPGDDRNTRPEVISRRLVRWLEDQERLDGIAEKLSSLVRMKASLLPGGQAAVDALHGKQLGHPLHPILTDLPIGAFTFAAMFDATTIGRKKPSKAATTLIAAGLATVPITALAGALDWQHTYGRTKRVGTGHLLLNSLGSAAMAASLYTRLRGRGPTRTLNFLGNGILTLSAYLGGHLVYEGGVGVRHDSSAAAPEHYVPVLPLTDLREQVLTRVEASGYPIALYKRFGRVYAVGDVCPHLGCSLSEGEVEEDAVVCGCHGSKFALEDGAVERGPSTYRVPAFVTRIVNGTIEVAPLPES
jgi:nitrite reductase/ring-hydroxylating ferredoxin subunit/uncharacterized membrane protein